MSSLGVGASRRRGGGVRRRVGIELVDDLPEKELPRAARVLEALRDTGGNASHAAERGSISLNGQATVWHDSRATRSAEKFEELEAAIAETEQIDEELWR